MAFYVALNSQEASFERADVVVRKRLQLRLRDSWAVLADAQEGFPTCGASKTGREALRLVKATVAEGESGDSHTVDLTGALAGELTWCPLARAGEEAASFFVLKICNIF